ncbi:MAG: primosomal protein N' [Pseudomonadota bacterium]
MSNQAHNKNARISVALDVPLRQVFDYLVEDDQTTPAVGCRVQVPFAGRKLIGVVWPSDETEALTADRLKKVSATIDEQPLLGSESCALIDFAARYYHHPVGEVALAALPPGLRAGGTTTQHIEWISLTDVGMDAIDDDLRKRAPRQHDLLMLLTEHDQRLPVGRLQTLLPGWRRVATTLLKRGWLQQQFQAEMGDWGTRNDAQAGPTLNPEQQSAVDRIIAKHDRFGCWLLDGVTGSGKTEVFMHLIAETLARGQQTLIIVPEIGLTPQLLGRLERRLGARVALLHSNLPDSERTSAWLAAARGDARIILGTRSAIFTPLAKPGLMIVDEEHDTSLKQHEGFRYHARDLAVWRARQANIPIVLSSATPSLESLLNVEQGRYEHLRLTMRAGNAQAPTIRIIDSNRFNLIDGISQPVIDTMRQHLEAGNQVLVYLNRRGFAPTLICTECGAIADCADCDAHMTVHASAKRLQCHHCGASAPLPAACSECQAPMRPLGEGTERVAEALLGLLPEYSLARIDSDTTALRGGLQSALAAARSGESRILIGTQMLAKGHHLPKLTLAVILNADQGFFASDFRAAERLAQSIVQVAGRAGRADTPGEVLIQTAYPQHRWLTALVGSGYGQFARDLLDEREQAQWPPYHHLAVLHAAASNEATAIGFLHNAKHALQANGIDTLGPAPASMLRRAGRYRYQLLLSSPTRATLQYGAAMLVRFLSRQKTPNRLRWSLDIDPQTEL